MGQVALDDIGITIRNPNFIGHGEWTWGGAPWSYVPQHAQMSYAGGPNNNLTQLNVGSVIGGLYRLTFTLANVALNNPAVTWLKIAFSSDKAFPFNTNGAKTVDILAEDSTDKLTFEMHNPIAGDFLELDTINIVRLGNYVQEIAEIRLAGDPKHEFYPAIKSDFMQVQASRIDHSGCWIAFNWP